ncbi:amino acid permease [Streptomyces sp. NPDC093795]|uniref:amino acid permease n=1 Tax=Streptomyces sp. NPDC093795 TaxID=3366051 RepID=UPI0037FCE63B
MTGRVRGAGLRQRHLAMIALGGAIGAGLFVGSGFGIAAAGPGILISYGLAGALTVLVMRMLGEMSAARPVTGSFAEHARVAFGPWAGLLAGWMYWALLVVSVAAEAVGAAHIVTGWVPAVPGWAWVAVFMSVFTVSNLAGVRNFGELEFWFAGLKLAAICGFLVLGAVVIAGLLPGHPSPGAAHLTGAGGFLPHGWYGVAVGMVAAVFAFGGLETVTIAAAECDDPVRAVRAGVRAVMWRVAVCYLGSMAVIVALVPWNDPAVADGPYAAVMARIGVPGTTDLMKAVVLVALLSAMNANIYGSSRMLYALVGRGDAPRALGRLRTGAGVQPAAAPSTGGPTAAAPSTAVPYAVVPPAAVPYAAVHASAAFGFVSVVLSLLWPRTVFPFLLNSIGAAILLVWALIAGSHLRLHGPSVRSVVALAGIGGVLLFMLGDAASRTQLLTTGAWAAALLCWALLRRLRTAPGTDPLPS